MKKCSKCGQLLPLDSFSKGLTYKDCHKSICKKCINEYNREYRVRKKERKKKLLGIKNLEPEDYLGGYMVYVLNHTKRGEFKYNVVSTKGNVFHTNNKEDFLSFLREV